MTGGEPSESKHRSRRSEAPELPAPGRSWEGAKQPKRYSETASETGRDVPPEARASGRQLPRAKQAEQIGSSITPKKYRTFTEQLPIKMPIEYPNSLASPENIWLPSAETKQNPTKPQPNSEHNASSLSAKLPSSRALDRPTNRPNIVPIGEGTVHHEGPRPRILAPRSPAGNPYRPGDRPGSSGTGAKQVTNRGHTPPPHQPGDLATTQPCTLSRESSKGG